MFNVTKAQAERVLEVRSSGGWDGPKLDADGRLRIYGEWDLSEIEVNLALVVMEISINVSDLPSLS